jgi:hypothetical protein
MKNLVNPGLKGTFWVHAVIAGVIGLVLLAVPETFGNWVAWEMGNPAYRMVGAFTLALSVTSVLAAMAEEWIEVRIKVGLELMWTFLASAVMLWAVLTDLVPSFAWVFISVFIIFFVVFAGYALVERKEEQALVLAFE